MMHEKFKKLLEKKGEEISPEKLEAKKNAVSEMRDLAASMMGDHLKGLKKVTVAAPDKQGLEEGLDKAKEIAHKLPIAEDEDDESSESPDMEASEEDSEGADIDSPEEQQKELEAMDPDELMKLIQLAKEELMKKQHG